MDFSFVQLSSAVIASFSVGFALASKITLLNSDNKTKSVACPMFKASGKICSETGSRYEFTI